MRNVSSFAIAGTHEARSGGVSAFEMDDPIVWAESQNKYPDNVFCSKAPGPADNFVG